MVDRDVVVGKVAALDRALGRIMETRGPRRASLLPVEVEEIVVLNLQRAVQAVIDLAAHVASSESFGIPDSTAASFTLLERHAVIDRGLADRLRRMAGFRNVAVHEYQTLDPAIVDSIVESHLGDLRAFAARIVELYRVG